MALTPEEGQGLSRTDDSPWLGLRPVTTGPGALGKRVGTEIVGESNVPKS